MRNFESFECWTRNMMKFAQKKFYERANFISALPPQDQGGVQNEKRKNVYTFFRVWKNVYSFFCAVFTKNENTEKNSKKNVYTFFQIEKKRIYVFSHEKTYIFRCIRFLLFLRKKTYICLKLKKRIFFQVYTFFRQNKNRKKRIYVFYSRRQRGANNRICGSI